MTNEERQRLRASLRWKEHRLAKSSLLKPERLEFYHVCCRTQQYSSPRFINWLTRHYPGRLYEAAAKLGMEV